MTWGRLKCRLGFHDDETVSGTYWTDMLLGTFVIDLYRCRRCERQIVTSIEPSFAP